MSEPKFGDQTGKTWADLVYNILHSGGFIAVVVTLMLSTVILGYAVIFMKDCKELGFLGTYGICNLSAGGD